MQQQDTSFSYFATLPEKIRHLIISNDIVDVTQAIGEEYSLSVSQGVELENIVVDILAGYTHPKHFLATITTSLGLEKDVAVKIAKDINKEIFASVKHDLITIHGIGDKKNATASETTANQGTPAKETSEENSALPMAPAPKKKIAQSEEISVPKKDSNPTPDGMPPVPVKKQKNIPDPYREPVED